MIDTYVRNCAWARDAELRIDPNQIICESYKIKEGSQRYFTIDNPLELIGGSNFFGKKTKLFDHVVGFAKFSEFLIVAEVNAASYVGLRAAERDLLLVPSAKAGT